MLVFMQIVHVCATFTEGGSCDFFISICVKPLIRTDWNDLNVANSIIVIVWLNDRGQNCDHLQSIVMKDRLSIMQEIQSRGSLLNTKNSKADMSQQFVNYGIHRLCASDDLSVLSMWTKRFRWTSTLTYFWIFFTQLIIPQKLQQILLTS